MDLAELKIIIDRGITRCEKIIAGQPKIVLSESDFEKLLAWCISKELGLGNYKKHKGDDYVVHSQISYYINKMGEPDELKYRVDLLLMTDDGIETPDVGMRNKGFRYVKDSFALELKYLKADKSVRGVYGDLKKRETIIEDNSWLYIVALIEDDDDDKYNEKYDKIFKRYSEIKSKNEGYKTNFHCKVIRKKELKNS